MIKISIIIPVYNVDKYIEKCINSCFNQDLHPTEYEIILINDGSTDDSLKIIDRIIDENPKFNIRIFSQKNSGLSVTRNIGLSLAEGKYVWFIDSDDWIEPNILFSLYQELETNHIDAIWMKWKRVDECGNILKKERFAINKESNSVLSGVCFLEKVFGFMTYAPTFIFRRLFLIENNFNFYQGIMYEDAESIPKIILSAQRIKSTPIVCYNYLNRQGSILNAVNSKKATDFIFVLERILEQYENSQILYFKRFFSYWMISALKFLSMPSYRCKFTDILAILKRHKFKYLCFFSSNIIDFLSIILFNISPRLLFFLYIMFRKFSKKTY